MPIQDIILFSTHQPESESYTVASEKLIDGDGRQAVHNHYADATGQFLSGIWEGQPATWRVRYSEHEFCHMLAGRVVMRDNEGGELTVSAGDSFVIPAGFAGTWQVLEPARKLYVIFEPKQGV